jgi:hypothetical protein
MKFQEFISKYDHPGFIVLLLGKRSVLENDQEKLIHLGATLANSTKYMTFRSGNAQGADHLFQSGVFGIEPQRLEIFVPYTGHRKNLSQVYSKFSLDDLNLAEEPEVIYKSRANKKTARLVDSYAIGNRDSYSMKASFIIRDTLMVIGSKSGIPPATVGLFYDDLDNPMMGGTGHTMKVCQSNIIPFFNQETWLTWI